MIHTKPKLTVRITKDKGRGVFTNCKIKKGEIIEVAPVIVLSRREATIIDELPLSSHLFEWGEDGKQTALVLGFGSIYNHSYNPNVVYKRHLKRQEIVFQALRDVSPGEELAHNYNGDPKSQQPIKFTRKGWWFMGEVR